MRQDQRAARSAPARRSVGQLGGVDLARQADRGRGQQQPEQHRPGVPHEHPGREEVVRQEAQAGAGDGHRDEARRRGPGQVLVHRQQVGVGEERQRADAHDSGGQTVQAVDEVHRVGAEHDEEDGDGHRGGAVQGDGLTRQRDPQHPDPEGDHDAGRQHLAGELGQRRQVEQVVQHPDQADHRRRRSTRPASPAVPPTGGPGTAAARPARSPRPPRPASRRHRSTASRWCARPGRGPPPARSYATPAGGTVRWPRK